MLVSTVLATSFAAKQGFPKSLAPGCLAPDDQTNLYCPGDDGYGCYKIPTILRTANGTLLAMIEARKYSCSDQGYVDLRLRRSLDQGKTWEPSQLVHGNSTEAQWTTVGDANIVQDVTTGIVWLLHTRNNTRLFVSHSADEGGSWSEPQDVTATLKYGYPKQGWIGTGHAGGIQLSSGPYKGRLIIPTYTNTSYAIYSDDHGHSWHMGGPVATARGGECQIAETGVYNAEGTPVLMFSMRPATNPDLPSHRLLALSNDGGLTWGAAWEASDLPEPIRGCDGSLVYHPGSRRLYFSHPDPPLHLLRTRLRVWTSSNLGATWEDHAVVWEEAAGYSALTVLTGVPGANSALAPLGILYDRNNHSMAIFEAQSISFTTIAA